MPDSPERYCPHCGYDLFRHPISRACPECGCLSNRRLSDRTLINLADRSRSCLLIGLLTGGACWSIAIAYCLNPLPDWLILYEDIAILFLLLAAVTAGLMIRSVVRLQLPEFKFQFARIEFLVGAFSIVSGLGGVIMIALLSSR